MSKGSRPTVVITPRSCGSYAGRGATGGRWTILSIKRRRARDSPPYLSLWGVGLEWYESANQR